MSASLLAGLALTGSRANALTAPGIIAAVVAGLALLWITVTAVIIWWPTEGKYRLDPVVIIQRYTDQGLDESATHRDLALYMAQHWEANAWSLDRRHRWFSAALIAFLVELVALGVALGM